MIIMLGKTKDPLKKLQKRLGYKFRDINLLKMALTHRSCRFENKDVNVDNQRLEFLGDAVLGFMTAAYLYEENKNDAEGVLTTLRSRVTSGKALAALATDIGVGEYIMVGKGEERSGGRTRPSSLTDALEAIFGAVYIDGGLKGFKKVFDNFFPDLINNLDGNLWAANPKGELQEYSQAQWKRSPIYHLVDESGPAHASLFTVEVEVNGKRIGHGIGGSKQEAERKAAAMALEGIH